MITFFIHLVDCTVRYFHSTPTDHVHPYQDEAGLVVYLFEPQIGAGGYLKIPHLGQVKLGPKYFIFGEPNADFIAEKYSIKSQPELLPKTLQLIHFEFNFSRQYETGLFVEIRELPVPIPNKMKEYKWGAEYKYPVYFQDLTNTLDRAKKGKVRLQVERVPLGVAAYRDRVLSRVKSSDEMPSTEVSSTSQSLQNQPTTEGSFYNGNSGANVLTPILQPYQFIISKEKLINHKPHRLGVSVEFGMDDLIKNSVKTFKDGITSNLNVIYTPLAYTNVDRLPKVEYAAGNDARGKYLTETVVSVSQRLTKPFAFGKNQNTNNSHKNNNTAEFTQLVDDSQNQVPTSVNSNTIYGIAFLSICSVCLGVGLFLNKKSIPDLSEKEKFNW